MFLTLICAKSRLGQPLSANDQLGYYQHQLILEDALFYFIFLFDNALPVQRTGPLCVSVAEVG